ncbi:lipoprotein [Enterococcus cecorum]|nr:lipoprotein [Enterococcus cecorum]
MKKKILTLGLALSATVLLAACGGNEKKDKENTTVSSSVVKTETKKEVDNSKYDDVVKSLQSELNPENDSDFTIEIENNVADSDFPDGHDVINVLLSGEAAKGTKEIVEAIDSNTADDTQKLVISAFKQKISEIAKNLPDDTTGIELKYQIAADQYRVVAYSTKTKDIIPLD